MRLQITVTRGMDMGKVFELAESGAYVLGRGDDCSIQLSDPRISRHHCRIDVKAGRAQLKDAESSWGTFVNGDRVTEYALQPGDLVTLVETEMRFEVASSAAATTWQPNQPPPTPGISIALPNSVAEEPQPSGVLPDNKDDWTSLLGAMAAPHDRNDHADLVGKSLGRFEILEIIARTRTGMLFRARDSKTSRPVALKVLWQEIARDDEEVHRFVRAVKSVLGVKHPNLINFYGAGKSRPRYCWTACELIEGDSLRDLMQRAGESGRLPWQQCLTIAIHIARSLEAAAARGFVHRNITPTNILVRRKDGVAKLGDLMLAKALQGTQAERITRPGETVGDIPYLSPEHLQAGDHLDSRSDMYSLGATLYEALTGRPPVEGHSLAEVVARIELEDACDPRDIDPEIPAKFASIIMQMLEKSPAKRFDSPQKLVRALEAAASATEQPTVPLPESDKPFADGQLNWENTWNWLMELPWPVRRTAIIVSAVTVAGITLGVIVSSLLSSGP
jgi:serine/threonine protein kinase